MNIKKIQTEFITIDVPNHKKHKPILLDLISKMPNKSLHRVSKTDWELPKDFKREYLEYFYDNIATDIMHQQKNILMLEIGLLVMHGFNSMKKTQLMIIIPMVLQTIPMFIS